MPSFEERLPLGRYWKIDQQSPQAHGLTVLVSTLDPRSNDRVLREQIRQVPLTAIASPPLVAHPTLGRMLSLNGTSQYAIASTGAFPWYTTTTPFSISTWFASTDTSGVIVSDYALGTSGGWFVQIDSGSVRWGFLNSAGSNGVLVRTTATTFADGLLHHVAATWIANGAITGLAIYVDGVAQALTNVLNGGVGTQADSGLALGASTVGTSLLVGSIGETRLYDHALSQGEVSSIYKPKTRWNLYKPLVPYVVKTSAAQDADHTGDDTGTLSDTASLAADLAGVDTLTVSEAADLLAAIVANDTHTLTETGEIELPVSDSHTLSETGELAAALSGTDTGTLSETEGQSESESDSGALSETGELSAAIPVTDTLTLSETGELTVAVPVSDTGTLSETAELTATIPVSDTGTLSEASEVEQTGNDKAGTDELTLTDTAEVTVSWSVSDTLTLTETPTIGLADSDSGALSEAGAVAAALSVADTFTLTEADGALFAAYSTTDNLTLSETGELAASLTLSDSLSLSDLAALGIITSDSGELSESPSLSLAVSDLFTFTEDASLDTGGGAISKIGSDSFVLFDDALRVETVSPNVIKARARVRELEARTRDRILTVRRRR